MRCNHILIPSLIFVLGCGKGILGTMVLDTGGNPGAEPLEEEDEDDSFDETEEEGTNDGDGETPDDGGTTDGGDGGTTGDAGATTGDGDGMSDDGGETSDAGTPDEDAEGGCVFSDGSCAEYTYGTCTDLGGTWSAAGCPDDDAGDGLLGSCTFDDGTCAEGLAMGECGGFGGSWSADDCPEEVTVPELGSCTFDDDTCADGLAYGECSGFGGSWSADDCPEEVTVPDLGSCTFVDGTCADGLAYGECSGFGGSWSGTPCPEPSDALWGENLLVNPGLETGDLTGWTVLAGEDEAWTNASDVSGSRTDSCLVTSGGREGAHAMATSFAPCLRTQEIDLLAAGFSSSALDAAPPITVSEWFKQVGDGADDYNFQVQLLASDGTEIDSINLDGGTDGMGTDWFEVTHTFSEYGSGLRYIQFEDGGNDSEYWAGHWGVRLDDASVILNRP